MIYLRLSGGLGNQLYQLAATALLSQLRATEVIVSTDALQGYKTPREPDSIKLLSPNPWLRIAKPEESNFNHWLTVKARAGRFLPVLGVNDKTFWSITNTANIHLPLYADGYFQHGWTQESFSKAVGLMNIRPISVEATNRLQTEEVAVHIRGGDFLKLPRYQLVHSPFYIEAVRQCLAIGLTRFAIVTDDPEYAESVCREIKGQFAGASFRTLGQRTTALEDFDTLRGATARIIGNSTFAWWAAALGSPVAPTWSPPAFTTDVTRDFFLPHERTVNPVRD